MFILTEKGQTSNRAGDIFSRVYLSPTTLRKFLEYFEGETMSSQQRTMKTIYEQETPQSDTSLDSEPLWTVHDVAEFLRLEPDTVRTMAREGKLPGVKVGRAWRFKKTTIIKYLELG